MKWEREEEFWILIWPVVQMLICCHLIKVFIHLMVKRLIMLCLGIHNKWIIIKKCRQLWIMIQLDNRFQNWRNIIKSEKLISKLMNWCRKRFSIIIIKLLKMSIFLEARVKGETELWTKVHIFHKKRVKLALQKDQKHPY